MDLTDTSARLKRVLEHERNLEYADRAVSGGLDALLANFSRQITWLDNVPPRNSRPYSALGPGERQAWVEQVIYRLERDRGQNSSVPGSNGVTNAGAATSGARENASTHPPSTIATGRPAATARQRRSPARIATLVALDTPLAGIPRIPRTTREKLANMQLQTLKDLLWLFPRRHVDYSQATKIMDLELNQETTVIAHVVRGETLPISRNGAAKVLFSDGTGLMDVTFFGQPYLAQQLSPGTDVALSGKVGEFRGQARMENPEYEVLSSGSRSADRTHAGNLLPVYPSTEGLQQRALRNATRKALDAGLPLLEDMLPPELKSRNELPELATAVRDMHYPQTLAVAEQARRRLAFDELFLNQLLVARRRAEWQSRQGGFALEGASERVRGFISGLEFDLTGDQHTALSELLADMAAPAPMARLLQGEVGSGKTVLALAALLACVSAGHRGAFMAPTEVLAEQHFLSTARQLGAEPVSLLPPTVVQAPVPGLRDEPVSVGLLTGSLAPSLKRQMHELIAAGRVDIIIGTHALLQDAVDIPGLALAVVDEQHRFGVEQRAAFGQREPRPHMLAMSATPIPRTLSLTVYGDLDVSVLKEMPHGRRPLRTAWARGEQGRRDAYNLLRSEVAAGRQAFVVCPLIDDSEQVDASAAVPEFERLKAGPLSELRLGLLHGRMTLTEKQAVMSLFRDGEIEVLVATPVIEVGVDVPNATVMLIESADRFGLAQLHQLRGRVGRGGHVGTCFLMSDRPSPEAIERLRTVEATSDGFELAEHDLRLRGPGEYAGTRQSGWSQMKVATPSDLDLIELCQAEARLLLEQDPVLDAAEHRVLKRELLAFAEGRPAELS